MRRGFFTFGDGCRVHTNIRTNNSEHFEGTHAKVGSRGKNQAPPSYGSGRYGFGVFGAQDSVLRDTTEHVGSGGDASRPFLDPFSISI